jgi:hypothetical protein
LRVVVSCAVRESGKGASSPLKQLSAAARPIRGSRQPCFQAWMSGSGSTRQRTTAASRLDADVCLCGPRTAGRARRLVWREHGARKVRPGGAECRRSPGSRGRRRTETAGRPIAMQAAGLGKAARSGVAATSESDCCATQP